MASIPDNSKRKKPSWLKVRLPSHANYFYVSDLVKKQGLHTICQSARCPNISECWAQKTATFLILGDVCTRDCAFCAVKTGRPGPVTPDEPQKVAESVSAMGLEYAVITSVTRDDLEDGGASVFAAVIRSIRVKNSNIKVEVLIPDFQGSSEALRTVTDAKPDVLNHNLEVPEKLYSLINRDPQNYRRSLRLLEQAKEWGAVTKSGIMIGLGETREDIKKVFLDLHNAGCDFLTVGQYLQATRKNAEVKKYYSPDEFKGLKNAALNLGFAGVVSGPLVRSSYMAHHLFRSGCEVRN